MIPLAFNGSAFRKFRRLTWPDRLMVVEATLTLIYCSVAIAILPFRYVARLSTRSARGEPPEAEARLQIVKRVRWAVTACSKRMPFRSLCFEEGLTAHLMLRRRGIPTVLYFGVARNETEGLQAHVWVRDGTKDVVGCENADRFTVLKTFPQLDQT